MSLLFAFDNALPSMVELTHSSCSVAPETRRPPLAFPSARDRATEPFRLTPHGSRFYSVGPRHQKQRLAVCPAASQRDSSSPARRGGSPAAISLVAAGKKRRPPSGAWAITRK